MPPPRNEQDVRRITKQLAHPRDRKVRQLEKRQARADRVSAQEAKRKQEKERLLLRMIWFREQCIALGYTKAAVPRALWMPLVRLFMARNEAEVASLKAMRNPPVGRIRLLEGLADEEKAELQSTRGFEIPALGEDDDVEILTEVWDCLLETSVVLEKAYVTARDASPEDAAVMAELAAKLKPIDEVRKDAEAVLPRRAQKFREKRRTSGAGAGLTRKDRGSGKVAADKKTSVKRLAAASGAEQRERVKETAHRKQQTAQKKHREALLESRRNAISE